VVETKAEGEIAIKSKRGNIIKKNASPSNPAVHVGRSGNDVVKRASELNVEEKGSASTAPNGDKKRDHDEVDDAAEDGNEDEEKGDAKEEAKKEKAPPAKKQKKEPAKKKEKAKKPAAAETKQANAEDAKKGRGRPKGSSGAATGATKKKKDPKPRATEGIGSRTRSRA
jgi:hypothetical protein